MESRLRRRDFSNEPSKKGMVMHTTEGLVSKPCAGSVETVWNRLLETLKTLNVPLFATVDHAANARAAGLFMPETRVAFSASPRSGRI